MTKCLSHFSIRLFTVIRNLNAKIEVISFIGDLVFVGVSKLHS